MAAPIGFGSDNVPVQSALNETVATCAPAEKVEDAALPLFSPQGNLAQIASLGSPTRGRKRKDQPSPSIQYSATRAKGPAVTHYPEIAEMPSQKFRQACVALEAKQLHTFVPVPNSVKKKAKVLADAYPELSRRRKHLEKHPEDEFSPLKAESYQIVDHNGAFEVSGRLFAGHKSSDPVTGNPLLCLYPLPKPGDDLVLFKQGTGSSPGKLAVKAKMARKSPDPKKSLVSLLSSPAGNT